MDYIRAFLTGGVICALVQILMEKTKMMPGRIMVLLVVCGAIGDEGILGAFKGGLSASSGGITAALIFGYLASLIFKPKMK